MKIAKKSDIIRIIFLIILITIAIAFFPKLLYYYERAETLIENSGKLGPLIYGLLMILAILIAPIPTSPLAIIAGILFGPWLGMLYTLIFATIGATLAFSLSRFFFRDYFSKYVEKHEWYKKFEGKNDINIAYLVFLTRLMPQASFDIVSYAAGLTRLNIWLFILVTFLGMIPIVFILSFFGYLIEPYRNIALAVLFIAFVIYLAYYLLKKKKIT